jgi:hypothetical protein
LYPAGAVGLQFVISSAEDCLSGFYASGAPRQKGKHPMLLPDYWLPRPNLPIDAATRAAFDALIAAARAALGADPINYTLAAPKWQFLCYAAETHHLAMHGSGNAQISVFEPRQSNDLMDFGNRKAVYAAGDGIWAMFFAVVDRDRFKMSISNACLRLADPAGNLSDPPRYIFSVSREALAQKPWRAGTVYLLPRDTFTEQDPIPFGEFEACVPQLASFEPVTPIARLAVSPTDFPFLDQVRAHDGARLAEYARALQSGAPWPPD